MTATMACCNMNSRSTLSPTEKITTLMDSWFRIWCSTEEMKMGMKNEDAVLQALSC
jgi:hypothetical protein